MATLHDLEVGDVVTVVFETDRRSPDTLQYHRETMRGEVLKVDAAGLMIRSSVTGSRTFVAAAAIRDIVEEGTVFHRRLDPTRQPVVVRVYPGSDQVDAAMAFAREANLLAGVGYLPAIQSWAVGDPGVGDALADGNPGAGANRPQGALTVTYVHRSASRQGDT